MLNIDRASYYLRAFLNMHVWRQTSLPYMPEYIGMEVTNVCNFKCAFCPQSDPAHHDIVPKTYLDKESCALYLRKIREAGIKTDLMHWTLDGEPFMHRGFADLVNVSADFGFTNTFFASNGVLCTVDRLLAFPLDRVRINLTIDFCADSEYFEKVRGTKGSWQRVLDNVRNVIADDRMNNVTIELTDIASYSTQDPSALAASFASLQGLFEKSDRLRFRTRTFHNATGYLKSNKRKSQRYHVCPYPFAHFRIASNGDVVSCSRDLQHKSVLGNLRHQSVEEIWNGEKFQNFRQALFDREPSRNGACRGCDLPYDSAKFSLANVYKAARGRSQVFTK
jgi:radical SAM protein with 4Fe4S-binding SPASM domain